MWFPICSSILLLPRLPPLRQKRMEPWSYKIRRLHEIIQVNHDRDSMKFLRGSLVSNQHCQTWDLSAIKCQILYAGRNNLNHTSLLQASHYIMTDMYIIADNWMKTQSQTKNIKNPEDSKHIIQKINWENNLIPCL